MAYYLDYQDKTYMFKGDIDLTSFAKSVAREEEDLHIQTLLKLKPDVFTTVNKKEIFLNEDDILLTKQRSSWYACKQNQKDFLYQELIKNGQLNLELLDDESYQQVFNKYKEENGSSYNQDEFQKDVLKGNLLYELSKNDENSLNHPQYKNAIENAELTNQNVPSPVEYEATGKITGKDLIAFIKDDSQLLFPFEKSAFGNLQSANPFKLETYGFKKGVLSDVAITPKRLFTNIESMPVIADFMKELNKLDLNELRALNQQIKEKNKRLEEEIKKLKAEAIKMGIENNIALTQEYENAKAEVNEASIQAQNAQIETSVPKEENAKDNVVDMVQVGENEYALKEEPEQKAQAVHSNEALNKELSSSSNINPNDSSALDELRAEAQEWDNDKAEDAQKQTNAKVRKMK